MTPEQTARESYTEPGKSRVTNSMEFLELQYKFLECPFFCSGISKEQHIYEV
jgi:hypothetical protein